MVRGILRLWRGAQTGFRPPTDPTPPDFVDDIRRLTCFYLHSSMENLSNVVS